MKSTSLRPVRTAISRAAALLIAGLVAVVLALTVLVPLIGGATTYTILTDSMRPGYPPGTVVAVKPVAPEDIGAGDVITFQIRSGEPTVATHRVTSVAVTTTG